MPKPWRLTRQAERALVEIARWTLETFGPRQAEAFDAELRARVPELVVELLGKPTFHAGQEWRWGRKGSLSVVVGGARAGMWFDY